MKPSKLQYVSAVKKADGRKGYIVQYQGKQRTPIVEKNVAEEFIRKLLIDEGVIGRKEPAPLKPRYRKKAKMKPNVIGLTLRRDAGVYEGSKVFIGRHRDLSAAISALKTAAAKQPGATRLGCPKVTRKVVPVADLLRKVE